MKNSIFNQKTINMKKVEFLYNVPFDYTLYSTPDLYLHVIAYEVNSGAAIYFDELPASMILSVTNWPAVLKEIQEIAIIKFNQKL
jgi:hypothetical protein